MPSVELRKRITLVEEIFHEGGPVARSPYRRAAILTVIIDMMLFGGELISMGIFIFFSLIASVVLGWIVCRSLASIAEFLSWSRSACSLTDLISTSPEPCLARR